MKRIFQNKIQSHEEKAKKSVEKQSPQQQINIANIQRAIEDPTSEALDMQTMMAIQQTHGNQFASQLTSPVQAKLTVTEANDTYEQEADAVAKQVVAGMNAPVQREEEEEAMQAKRDSLQRQPLEEEEEQPIQPKRDSLQRQDIPEEEEPIQAKREMIQRIGPADEDEFGPSNATAPSGPSNASAAGASSPSNASAPSAASAPSNASAPSASAPSNAAPTSGPSNTVDDDELARKPLQAKGNDDMMGGMDVSSEIESQIEQERGSGQALPDNVRSGLESGFGADFSNVRVHTDSTADNLSRSIQAQAFTTGSDIFFKQGSYDPNSQSGQELLAHELTHTIQQGASPKTEDSNE